MTSQAVFGAVFVGALFTACVTDVRARRIPNRLVLFLLLAGIVYAAVTRGTVHGVAAAAGAAALGFAIWIPFYAFRALGAGDVKLFAAASAWLSYAAVLHAALASALIGGVLALFWFFRSQGGRLATMRLLHATRQPGILCEPLPMTSRHQRVPYGVAMAVGLIVTAWRYTAWQ